VSTQGAFIGGEDQVEGWRAESEQSLDRETVTKRVAWLLGCDERDRRSAFLAVGGLKAAGLSARQHDIVSGALSLIDYPIQDTMGYVDIKSFVEIQLLPALGRVDSNAARRVEALLMGTHGGDAASE
jgi:hypothetical protein